MKIYLVTSANAHLYPDELEAFFRARYRIYVEEKGWMPKNKERSNRGAVSIC